MITTTLADIRAASPCRSGWEKLLLSLGGVGAYDDRAPLPVARVLKSNGVADTLWVLANACGDEGKRFCVVFTCDAAERVLTIYERRYPSDDRPRRAIETARAYAAARAAAYAAADAAAYAVVYAAARAASDAAYAAYAAYAADASDAVYAAYAAYAADAAYASDAVYAAYAADAAYVAAYAAARAEEEWQERHLRELLEGAS